MVSPPWTMGMAPALMEEISYDPHCRWSSWRVCRSVVVGSPGARAGARARMRLRLADLLLKAGNEKDAVAILTGVAEDLAAAGRADKAIAVLMKIEKIANRDVQELCLAPLARVLEAEDEESAHGPGPRAPRVPEEAFRGWLFQVLGDINSEAESSDTVRIDLAPLRRPALSN
jgi:hypothetical protein